MLVEEANTAILKAAVKESGNMVLIADTDVRFSV